MKKFFTRSNQASQQLLQTLVQTVSTERFSPLRAGRQHQFQLNKSTYPISINSKAQLQVLSRRPKLVNRSS